MIGNLFFHLSKLYRKNLQLVLSKTVLFVPPKHAFSQNQLVVKMKSDSFLQLVLTCLGLRKFHACMCG